MSLLQRVERAQRAAETPGAAELVPVIAPLPPQTAAQVAGREELLRNVRLRLKTEVIVSFDTLLDVGPAEARGSSTG
jgi:hypothetical protein